MSRALKQDVRSSSQSSKTLLRDTSRHMHKGQARKGYPKRTHLMPITSNSLRHVADGCLMIVPPTLQQFLNKFVRSYRVFPGNTQCGVEGVCGGSPTTAIVAL